jgi:hypothetical protein
MPRRRIAPRPFAGIGNGYVWPARPRRRLRGLGSTSAGAPPGVNPSWSWLFGSPAPQPAGYTGVQVTDPSVIASLQQTAQNNGIDPASVTQMIAQGLDAVQIAQAVTYSGAGPQSALQQNQFNTALAQTTYAGPNPEDPNFAAEWAAYTGGGAPPAAVNTSLPDNSGGPSWWSQYWPFVAGAGVLAFIAWDVRR